MEFPLLVDPVLPTDGEALALVNLPAPVTVLRIDPRFVNRIVKRQKNMEFPSVEVAISSTIFFLGTGGNQRPGNDDTSSYGDETFWSEAVTFNRSHLFRYDHKFDAVGNSQQVFKQFAFLTHVTRYAILKLDNRFFELFSGVKRQIVFVWNIDIGTRFPTMIRSVLKDQRQSPRTSPVGNNKPPPSCLRCAESRLARYELFRPHECSRCIVMATKKICVDIRFRNRHHTTVQLMHHANNCGLSEKGEVYKLIVTDANTVNRENRSKPHSILGTEFVTNSSNFFPRQSSTIHRLYGSASRRRIQSVVLLHTEGSTGKTAIISEHSEITVHMDSQIDLIIFDGKDIITIPTYGCAQGEPESVKQRRVSTLGYLIPKRRMSNKLTCMIRIRNQSYFTFEHDKSPAIELTSKCRSEFHSTTLTRHLLYAEKQHRLTGETKKAFAAELFIRETPTQQLQTIGQGSKTLICIFFTKLNIHLLLERGFLNFPSYSLTVAPMQANATKRLRKFRNRSHFSRDAKRIYEKTCYSHTSSEYPPLHQ
ncbi:hypothetical protein CLF_101220 [Clonorchis sinensis]|uniref:Uncharacterized protein n=1 Tax=Clonorchis sinensis TaxID=79923 RepID=G7Y592_CLOSI|nr:hypothetical protein CLF_101220 [Clonorchis sinensis]